MKPRLYMGLFALALISSVATATPVISSCPSNVGFDTYVALGAGGCVLDDKLFYNFLYSGSGSGGATPIPASGVTVTTFDVALFPGFQFQGAWTAGPGQTLDSLLQFDVLVLGGRHPITDIHASMGGFGHVGDGIAAVAENISGTFAGNILLVDFSGGTVSTQTILVPSPGTFGPIHITKDISVNGNSGLATVSQVVNRFSEADVPEPGTALFMGAGLIGIGLVARRRKLS